MQSNGTPSLFSSRALRLWSLFAVLSGWIFVVGCELEPDVDDPDAFNGGDAGNDTGGGGNDTGTDTNRGCGADNFCNTTCSNDPDCGCACERQGGRCDAVSAGSSASCGCDNDCSGRSACLADGSCDTFCPNDPDCVTETECQCDYNGRICEASRPGSSSTCTCDPDCSGGRVACSSDGHCDTFCPRDTDPDCRTSPTCSCDYNEGICEAKRRGSSDNCECDEDCDGTFACKSDGHCDTWCPAGDDPDC